MAERVKSVVAAEDRISMPHKLAYGVGGVVDILSVWVLVNIAYQAFNMELKMPLVYVSIIVMALRLWDGIIGSGGSRKG
jgi:hypothetical protein